MKLFIDFFLIAGIVLNLIILLKLIRTKNKQLPQKILVIFWGFILLYVVYFYGYLHQLNIIYLTTYTIVYGSRFLLASLIYLYVKSIFYEGENFLKKHFLHFLPYVIDLLIYTIPNFVNIVSNKDIFSYVSSINIFIPAIIKDSYAMLYLIMSLILYYKYEPRLKQVFSTKRQQDFLWIRKFIISFIIALSIDLVLLFVAATYKYYVEWDGYITMIFVVIAMGYLVYYGLNQTTILFTETISDQTTFLKKNYKHKIIKPSEEDELNSKLDKLFLMDKVHLNPDLNLNELSQKMEVSSRKLSSFLNDVLNKSFYDIVNYHRVEEAKSLLVPEKINLYSVTAIGELSGFKSKSSFYRIFKQLTGYSPSEYIKSSLS